MTYPDPYGGGAPYAPAEPPTTTHNVQSVVEGVPDVLELEFLGDKFRLSDSVGYVPILRFADAANAGGNSSEMKGLAAIYAVVRECIHRPVLRDPQTGQARRDPETDRLLRSDAEWERFQEWAIDEGADDEAVLDFMNRAIEAIAARKAQRRALSSSGARATSQSSKAVSSSPATRPGTEDLTPVADLVR